MRFSRIKSSLAYFLCAVGTLTYSSVACATPGYTAPFYINTMNDAGDGTPVGIFLSPASPATVDNTSGCSTPDNYSFDNTDSNYKEKY